jgi:signal transduction histidine kinase
VSRPRTLRGKLARLVAAASLVSLLVFSAVAFLAIYLEDELKLSMLPEADDDATQFLLLAFLVAAPITLVITITTSMWIARRSLRPVEDVIRAAGEMSVDHLDRRIEVPADRDELHDMVSVLNGLFDRLERGFQGLNSFAADASHEEWSESAEQVLLALRRMVQLVDSLLELARGGIAGPREPIDVNEVVDEVAGVFATRFEEAGVTLEPSPETAEDAVAHINRAALVAALSAVVSNALRYTPRGGRAAVAVEPIAGRRVAIHVDDSGPGVPPEERTAIFEPLRRGAAGKQAGDEDGLGLGLAIARRILEQLDGAITVTRSPLGGARFTLEVPAASS